MGTELLNISGLCGGYGRIPILNSLTMSLRRGDLVAVAGQNGMGKTTFLKTLSGHLPATKGKIDFDGVEIQSLPPEDRARLGIGYVPQGRRIFAKLSVLDNLRAGAIRFPKNAAAAKVAEVIELLPRLKPLLERDGGVLSGGEQQILALARCLCGEPKLILLDEPTEGIQPSIREEIAWMLRRINREMGLTILVVEQDMHFIGQLTDTVRIIQKGTIAAHEQALV